MWGLCFGVLVLKCHRVVVTRFAKGKKTTTTQRHPNTKTLPRESDRTFFADDGDFDLSGILHFVLYAL